EFAIINCGNVSLQPSQRGVPTPSEGCWGWGIRIRSGPHSTCEGSGPVRIADATSTRLDYTPSFSILTEALAHGRGRGRGGFANPRASARAHASTQRFTYFTLNNT